MKPTFSKEEVIGLLNSDLSWNEYLLLWGVLKDELSRYSSEDVLVILRSFGDQQVKFKYFIMKYFSGNGFEKGGII